MPADFNMPEEPTVNDMMAAYALDAVDHAKAAMGLELDFTPESVRHVETILTEMYDTKPRGFVAKLFRREPPPKMIDQFCKMYGGYIGEVIRRHAGGEWFFDEEIMPGGAVIALRNDDGGRAWPTMKVGKRLTNGVEDNVWHYFQIMKDEYWKPSGGG